MSKPPYPAETLPRFLKHWDETYLAAVSPLSLFDPTHTAAWTLEKQRGFCQRFYHIRGHFYQFLWLLGNTAPNQKAKAQILDNIAEEFGGDHPSHETLYAQFAQSLGIDITPEFFNTDIPPEIATYNLRHLTWLNQQDWAGKWAGFSAYERLDNTDYRHLEQLARSFGIDEDSLLFFKVHHKADHFDRTYDTLQTVWQQESAIVKTAFDFIAQHQINLWQWLSHVLEG